MSARWDSARLVGSILGLLIAFDELAISPLRLRLDFESATTLILNEYIYIPRPLSVFFAISMRSWRIHCHCDTGGTTIGTQEIPDYMRPGFAIRGQYKIKETKFGMR